MATAKNQTAWDIIQSLFNFQNPKAYEALIGDHSASAIRSVIYYFNFSLLSAVVAIYAFILIIGTINTAKDGAFLGKEWNSYWIPLRVILGSAFAIPLKSGFCMAQYLIFMMISVSIMFANKVWHGATHEIERGAPPIVSSNIIDGIKTDLAAYMLSNYVTTLINASGEAPKDGIYKTFSSPKVDQISLATTGKQIMRSLSRMPSGDIEKLDSIYHYSHNKTELNLNNIQRIEQAQQQWSQLDPQNSEYVQYYIYKIINNYSFKVNSTKVDNNKVNENLTKSCGNSNTNCLKNANIIANYKGNSEAYALYQNNKYFLSNYSRDAVSYLLNKENKDDKAKDEPSEKDDWWNADQKYFSVNEQLEKNLQILYANFSIFDDFLKDKNNSHIQLTQTATTLHYLQNNISVSTFIHDIDNDRKVKYITAPTPPKEEEIFHPIPIVNSNKDVEEFLRLDMKKTKKQIVDILTEAKLSCGTAIREGKVQKVPCNELAEKIIPNEISADIGKYFMLIDVAINNVSASKDQQKIQTLALKLKELLYLIQLFELNNVRFFQDGTISNDQSSEGKKLLDEILAHFNNTNGSSILTKIYNIGENIADDPTKIMDSAFSILNQIQDLGQYIIATTLNIFTDITGKANQAWDDLVIENTVIRGTASIAAMAIAPTSFFAPGLPTAIINAGNLGADIASMITMYNLSMNFMWLPLVFFVLMTTFGIAVMFTLIVPLTPFMLFWAGKVAWLLLIIEALIAAPLVSLGIVYPEGHQVFGKAEPALQIMLNLILRPVLMVIGLLIGIILSYIVISFSAHGFHAIATQLTALSGDNLYVSGSLSILLVFMYASFICMAFYKCFSLIYLLPDKVLHWVGGSHNERAGAEDMQEMKSSTMQSAQGMGQASTQTLEKSNQATLEQAKEIQNTSSHTSKSTGDTAEKAGEHIQKQREGKAGINDAS
ncbi:DotA/TraY family protein [Fangia hongkongensis]|uniref:DotA/TraY family protein n=3 Tax=Fangia hongkongensis TaxID=270495 RepID=UPI000374C17A|nr:DotA/TraY family protein [Fangia hongkongensis]